MADSMSSLKDQLSRKKRELDSVGNKVMGAAIGASVVGNSALGMAAGALLGREKNKRQQIEAEISAIEAKIAENEREISRLKTQLTQVQNKFQNSKINFEADVRQKRNTLESRRHTASTPDEAHTIDQELMKLQSESTAKEQQDRQSYEAERLSIQNQINNLAL